MGFGPRVDGLVRALVVAVGVGACSGDGAETRAPGAGGDAGAAPAVVVDAERGVVPDTGASPVPAVDAAAVIRHYYAAIDARDFERAYALWRDDGAASGQSLEAFAAGFAETAEVRVEVGEPTRTEGAAGSVYVRVPVVVHAMTRAGVEQRFRGTYTLRRSVADGASAEERAWRIDAAAIRAFPQ